MNVVCSIEAIQETGARYLVTHTHPDIPILRPSGTVLGWLQTHAAPLVVFDPFVNAEGMPHCFFQGDVFYLPYCGFEGVERGGPVVTIWDLGAPRSPPPERQPRLP